MSYLQLKQTNLHKKMWICSCGRKNDKEDEKCAFCREKKPSKERKCLECGNEFIVRHHGGTKQFCSYSCSNKYKWRYRKRKEFKVQVKICVVCGNEYKRDKKLSLSQWEAREYCTIKCSATKRIINDGMSNGERCRRKKGRTKQGSAAWLEVIRARTKEGMMKPDVLAKLTAPRIPLSDSHRMKISDALVGLKPQNLYNGSYSNVQRGTYECSKGSVFFRSKWEANYALYLDFLVKQDEIKDWLYEEDVFFFEQIKLGTRSYTPDFKITNNDDSVEYHEVKGYMDSRSRTKLKRMGIYFPGVKLILIEQKFYTSLLKKLKGIIKFY